MKKKLLIIFVILGVVILRNNYSLRNDIAVYIGNEETKEVPKKNTGYVFDRVECDSDVEASWNSDTWSLSLNKLNTKTRCSLYFEEDKVVKKIIDSLDTTGKCPTVNSDGSVNVTAAAADNSLVCSAQDNYGTSYYFRGNAVDNYVKFANFYWRIVRINGDGSIRMIYDGTIAHANGESSEDRIIGTSAFNEKSDDNAYVGYMYGTPGSSTYEDTHANINDSTIKKYIDAWYENNIKGTNNEQYLADNIFCNDRDFNLYKSDNLGYSKNVTLYRWSYGPWDGVKYGNSNVELNCSIENDTFSINKGFKNNGALKYPIALINTDETVLAGGFGDDSSTKYYLYTGSWYWSLTPYEFDGGAIMRSVGSRGNASSIDGVFKTYGGVKPVINLKPNSLKNGTGTMDDPYTVE